MAKVKKPFPDADKFRHSVLSDNELKAIVQFGMDYEYPMGHWLVVLYYVGQRREEVAGMRWSELDFTTGIRTIPPERTKNGKEHKVPLCKMVMEKLLQCPRYREGGDYVFSTEYGQTYISGYSKFKTLIDKATGVKRWTYHDLRRTLATNMSKSRVSDMVISAVLNHSTAKLQGVTSIYNQHDYLAERITALNNYGAWLDRLVSDNVSDKVVELVR